MTQASTSASSSQSTSQIGSPRFSFGTPGRQPRASTRTAADTTSSSRCSDTCQLMLTTPTDSFRGARQRGQVPGRPLFNARQGPTNSLTKGLHVPKLHPSRSSEGPDVGFMPAETECLGTVSRDGPACYPSLGAGPSDGARGHGRPGCSARAPLPPSSSSSPCARRSLASPCARRSLDLPGATVNRDNG